MFNIRSHGIVFIDIPQCSISLQFISLQYYQHFKKTPFFELDFYHRNEFTKHHKENVSERSTISPYV